MFYSSKMVCPRFLLFCLFLAITSTKHAAAQDSFGEILLQAFTSGMAPPTNPGPTPAPTTPVVTSEEFLPEETFEPIPSSDAENEPSLAPAEPSMELEIGTPEPESPSPSSEIIFDEDGSMILPSSSPFPEFFPEGLPNESFDPLLEESPSPTAYVPVDDDESFLPIRVNCGSFDERSAFREDADKWFNVDSLSAEDPYALARFSSIAEAVLYATYRFAEEVLTYSVPLPTSGLFELTLHWAEISPLFMQEGARVFEVMVNGKVVEPSLDVFGESMYGSYSPVVRSYLIDAPQKVITIQVVRKTGQPMLSAFQIQRPDMSEQHFSM